MHYVLSQASAAANGLIGHEMVALAVEIGKNSVKLYAVVSEQTDEVVEDFEEICNDFERLLNDRTPVTGEISIGFGPLGLWPPQGAIIIYHAKGAREAEFARIAADSDG